MTWHLPLDLDAFVGIATIFGVIAAWIALYPLAKPYFHRLTGNIPALDDIEKSYLESLVKDLESKNQNNYWSDRFYVEVDTELHKRDVPYNLPRGYYVVKSINRHLKEQDFNNLSNVEKIDSSRGSTFTSLETALSEVQDNAVVVIAPPGNGKTVSLRNLTIKKANQRLNKKSKLVPIFINLGNYTSPDGGIKDFGTFIEEYFSGSRYDNYLSNRHWETLLKEARCIFFLDGIDELPRKREENERRSRKIADFVRAWPNVQFILSCRELDYNRELAFQQVLIKPFDRDHIRSYMKKYFSKADFKSIFRQAEESSGIYELCGNPFYLNLICCFSKNTKRIPENKAQLFDRIIDQFIERENLKQKVTPAPAFRDDFILTMSHLAYYMAVEKMTTTIRIDDYDDTIRQYHYYVKFRQMIEYAKKGELLEFNDQTREIRFIHNRFQEFFSSYYILSHYRQNKTVLPSNIFTNIWWKETALFVAGLETKVDDFIFLILAQRDELIIKPKIVEKLIKLEMTALAFECIFGNLNFNNDALYEQVRNDLLREYDKGDTLVKAKVLAAFRHDKSPEVSQTINKAVEDESLWVSERAFFMLSDKQLKIQMTFPGVLKEFFRFFIEGRLLNTFIPILKSSRKSRLVKMLLPLYGLLIVASFFSILLVGYVFYSFFEHMVFKLKWAFTAECLGCLGTITLGIYIIVYSLTSNNYPIFKRFIYVVPLGLMVRYLVFNLPNGFLYRVAMYALGLLCYGLYRNYLKKPNESNWSVGSITAFFLGFSTLVPLFNFKTVSQMFNLQLARNKAGSSIAGFLKTLEAIQPFLMLAFLIIGIVALAVYIYRQIRVHNQLDSHIQKVDAILASYSDETVKAKKFAEMFKALSLIWTQKILLKKILEKMTTHHNSSREQKMSLLDVLAGTVKNVPLRDAIFQHLEDEENNFRRSF